MAYDFGSKTQPRSNSRTITADDSQEMHYFWPTRHRDSPHASLAVVFSSKGFRLTRDERSGRDQACSRAQSVKISDIRFTNPWLPPLGRRGARPDEK